MSEAAPMLRERRARSPLAALIALAGTLLPSTALAHLSTVPDTGAGMRARSAASPHAGRGGQPGTVLVIRGAGDGHGVGMSQQGALGYAQHGWSYEAILAHYYAGTALGTVPRGRKVRVLMGGHVVRIPLERYVRGVISAEMPAEWPMAALEAQAVATRTYALTAHAGGARFDVYADTRSQVYEGKAAETPRTNAAAAATAGEVVTYGGHPAITYFFASSGGLTEAIQNAFPGAAAEPWLRGVPDSYERGGLHRWTIRMTLAQAASDLAGLVRGSLRGIEVLKRGYSPRIVRAELLGSEGTTQVSGPELAARLNLYSTWAHFWLQSAHGTRAEPDLSHYTRPAPEAPGSPAPPPAPGGGGPPGPPEGGGSAAPGTRAGGAAG
jgi:SpoIID/LytB domain protein